MDDRFKIFIGMLQDGHVEKIDEVFPPDFIDVEDPAFAYRNPVKVAGEAYLADQSLVFHFDVAASVKMPCRICNEPVDQGIEVQGAYHIVSLDEIKGDHFNISEPIRETLLLETPKIAECSNGSCSKREEFKQYLKSRDDESGGNPEDNGFQPFSDLKIND